MGGIKGDTRSLDHGSYIASFMMLLCRCIQRYIYIQRLFEGAQGIMKPAAAV